MTRATCLLGSPRPGGNSDILAERFCSALEVHGAAVRIHTLRDLRYQGYVPDAERHKDETLGEHHDDLEQVLDDVRRAQIVVLATPVYFCGMSGLLKQAFDRFYELLEIQPDGKPKPRASDKTLVLVQAQGEDEARYGDLLDQYAPALDILGFARRELVRACGVRTPGAVLEQPETLSRADFLARSLLLGENTEPCRDGSDATGGY